MENKYVNILLINLQLIELDEFKGMTYENTRIYKERAKKYHDQHIKQTRQFKEGDLTLLYNSRR